MKENEKNLPKIKFEKFIISVVTTTNEASGARKCDKILSKIQLFDKIMSRNDRKMSQNGRKLSQNETIFSKCHFLLDK